MSKLIQHEFLHMYSNYNARPVTRTSTHGPFKGQEIKGGSTTADKPEIISILITVTDSWRQGAKWK